MNSIKEKAYAKLNISLDVSSRRQDGYHDMVMVMQTISLFDQVELSLRQGPGQDQPALHPRGRAEPGGKGGFEVSGGHRP